MKTLGLALVAAWLSFAFGSLATAQPNFRDCETCPEMVALPGGEFAMGGTEPWELPVHAVRIKPFALGKTEITRAQWRAVMGKDQTDPKSWKSPADCTDTCPVTNVSWDDAQTFARKLSERTGKSYRLPSESEWEYACRAGGRHRYCGGNDRDEIGWIASGSTAKGTGMGGEHPYPVAGKRPNAWGLYDMSGNVWEWVQDCWSEGYTNAPNDGSALGPTRPGDSCGRRVNRGGAWNRVQSSAQPGSRSLMDRTFRMGTVGFRVARSVP